LAFAFHFLIYIVVWADTAANTQAAQSPARYTPLCNLPLNPANVLQLKYIFGWFFELRDQQFCINGMTV